METGTTIFNLLFYYFGKLYAWIMNAQLKGSFLISLSKDCLYSSGATLILIFVLKLRKQSQWAVQKVVALKGETFQWRIFCLEGGWGDFRTITSPFSSLFKKKMSLCFRYRSPHLDLLCNVSCPQRKSSKNIIS